MLVYHADMIEATSMRRAEPTLFLNASLSTGLACHTSKPPLRSVRLSTTSSSQEVAVSSSKQGCH